MPRAMARAAPWPAGFTGAEPGNEGPTASQGHERRGGFERHHRRLGASGEILANAYKPYLRCGAVPGHDGCLDCARAMRSRRSGSPGSRQGTSAAAHAHRTAPMSTQAGRPRSAGRTVWRSSFSTGAAGLDNTKMRALSSRRAGSSRNGRVEEDAEFRSRPRFVTVETTGGRRLECHVTQVAGNDGKGR